MGQKGEKLIGFDIRKMWLRIEQLWDEERRSRYLLRGDCLDILSVDRLVWPSVFKGGVGGVSAERLTSMGYDGPAVTEEWIGPNRPLWESLVALKAEVAACSSALRGPAWAVAITVLASGPDSQLSSTGPYLEDTIPPSLSLDWQLVGYDVADSGQISGLSNCGYSPAEREVLAQRWGKRLSPHHLFRTSGEAEEFAADCDIRVKEHAPFFVYGIYRVEIINHAVVS